MTKSVPETRQFLVNFMKRLLWKQWPLEKFRLEFWIYFPKFYDRTEFDQHRVAGEKVINYPNSQIFLFLTTLRRLTS